MTSRANAVVVGYDGSPASQTAASWAATEAERLGAKLRLVHVLALPVSSSPFGIAVTVEFEPLRHAAHELLDKVSRRIRADHRELAIEVVVEFGGTAPTLLQEATQARLVVLGSRGLGEFRDLTAGSVSAHVATHAPCPVVVIPADWSSQDADGVVVGVDGSELSIDAVDFAFEQAQARNMTLTAVMAWHDPVRTGPGDLLPLVYDLDALEQESAALLAESVAGHSAKYPDVVVRQELVRGHPDDVLIDAGRSAELLVVGSRGRGAFRGLLLGSTSRALVHYAPCPIAVVR
ncbi:nucleotide-binding universal stress UspA family protein [Kribbella voronezhensis]|uniref:Nucleotide-binding universal stress UspA family protein n=1 Tax=Kribbella voronezhensis TaxID=2512212 RepID=A0A4R7SYH0_9ACTN|nr:universal stress protein [Kribbella voronezhensis]TDU83776.1 nucleotide-binding universal stress UspA family protein [Kribbella voronezhensis]